MIAAISAGDSRVGIRIGSARAWTSTALLAVLAGVAHASSVTSTFAASAMVSPACTVNATNLSFGTYSPSATTALAGTASLSVYCTVGSSYSVALNVGSAGGLFAARVLANGLNLLGYNLYTSAALTTVWGDGTLLTGVVSGTGLGMLTPSSNTVYGVIPTSQDLPAGTYTSTVTVTVNY